MNAKPVRQFVQVPLVHYSTLATSADDLANNMSAMLSAIESPKSVSKTEWEKLKADSQKSVAAVKAEVEEVGKGMKHDGFKVDCHVPLFLPVHVPKFLSYHADNALRCDREETVDQEETVTESPVNPASVPVVSISANDVKAADAAAATAKTRKDADAKTKAAEAEKSAAGKKRASEADKSAAGTKKASEARKTADGKNKEKASEARNTADGKNKEKASEARNTADGKNKEKDTEYKKKAVEAEKDTEYKKKAVEAEKDTEDKKKVEQTKKSQEAEKAAAEADKKRRKAEKEELEAKKRRERYCQDVPPPVDKQPSPSVSDTDDSAGQFKKPTTLARKVFKRPSSALEASTSIRRKTYVQSAHEVFEEKRRIERATSEGASATVDEGEDSEDGAQSGGKVAKLA